MGAGAVSSDLIRPTLEKILASSLFQSAGRSRALLKFIVQEYAASRLDRLKEYTIGAEALGRGDSFDPRTDPIVRAEASRLRERLKRYYETEGQNDAVVVLLPKGGYVPEFVERNVSTGKAAESSAPPVKTKIPERKLFWIATGALAAIAALVILAVAPLWKRSSPPQLIQFDVELKTQGTLDSEVGTDVTLSPDASRLIFVTLDEHGVSHLNVRGLGNSEVTELSGTQGARNPFFSPDGDWVAFWSDGKLMKRPPQGGSPVILCDATDLLGGTWGEDGTIIASLGDNKLWRIPATGGVPSVVLDLKTERSLPAWPQMLSDDSVLFTNLGFSGPNGATIEALSLKTHKRTVLARGGTFGRYLPNGYLTYVNQGTLYALPFDLNQLKVQGTPKPVLDHLAYSLAFGYAQLSFSRTGVVVYRRATDAKVIGTLQDSAGQTQPLLAQPGQYLWPRISPDGNRVAFSVTENGVSNIAIYDRLADSTVRLQMPGAVHIPLWTKDGRFLIIGGLEGLTYIRANGSGKPVPLLKEPGVQVPWSLSADGRRLAFHQLSPKTGFDLWTVSLQSSATGLTVGAPEPFLQTSAFETYPSFSPDGKWISYASNESGSWQVYVRTFPDGAGKVQVSTSGGRISFWSPDGHELYYRTDDQRIMVARCTVRHGTFVVDSVRPWAQVRLADTGVLANLDLAPDGQHFLLLTPADSPENQQSQNHVTFMLNFFDELGQRARPGDTVR